MPANEKTTSKRKTTKAARKAPKTRKNQPVTFQEVLTPALPLAPATLLPAGLAGFPHLSDRTLRTLLIVIWLFALIAAGAGLGLLLRGHSIALGPAPEPVASTKLSVGTVTSPDIAGTVKPDAPNLTVTPASAVSQASAGQPFATANIDTYQAATGPDTLQPGYSSAPSPQGTRGTDPVE